jgi:hypothetical protein
MITKENHNFNIATQSNLDQKRVDSVLFYQPGSGFDIKETKFEFLRLAIGEEETEFHNRPLAKRFHKFSKPLNYSQIFSYLPQSLVFPA